MIVSFPPVGPTDLVAGVIAQEMSKFMGPPVAIDNRHFFNIKCEKFQSKVLFTQ